MCTYVQSSKATHLGCRVCIVYLKRNENFALSATNEECGSFRSITAGGVGIQVTEHIGDVPLSAS